jgi:hypothetical protein
MSPSTVLVDDTAKTLEDIEAKGGKIVQPVMEIPNGPTIALFADRRRNDRSAQGLGLRAAARRRRRGAARLASSDAGPPRGGTFELRRVCDVRPLDWADAYYGPNLNRLVRLKHVVTPRTSSASINPCLSDDDRGFGHI